MTDDAQERFEQRLRSLISERTNGGETTTDVSRLHVEQIASDLEMTPAQASTQFFALRGFVWDVADMGFSMIHSEESSALPPPRNWLGINDVYLIG